jgi:hypothetical protein
MNTIILNPLNVTINQVSLGKKKLTKSIFNHVEFADCFDKDINFRGESIIGYVKDKGSRYLLWVTEGKIRKTGLTKYQDLRSAIEFSSLKNTEWFLIKTSLKYSASDDYGDKLSEGLEEPERYTQLVSKAKDFLGTLTDKQIFI